MKSTQLNFEDFTRQRQFDYESLAKSQVDDIDGDKKAELLIVKKISHYYNCKKDVALFPQLSPQDQKIIQDEPFDVHHACQHFPDAFVSRETEEIKLKKFF